RNREMPIYAIASRAVIFLISGISFSVMLRKLYFSASVMATRTAIFSVSARVPSKSNTTHLYIVPLPPISSSIAEKRPFTRPHFVRATGFQTTGIPEHTADDHDTGPGPPGPGPARGDGDPPQGW